MGIADDEYTAYCLDEAIAYITSELMTGKKPRFERVGKDKKGNGHLSSFRELYKKYDKRNQ